MFFARPPALNDNSKGLPSRSVQQARLRPWASARQPSLQGGLPSRSSRKDQGWHSAADLPDVSKCVHGVAQSLDHLATLHGVDFDILVGAVP